MSTRRPPCGVRTCIQCTWLGNQSASPSSSSSSSTAASGKDSAKGATCRRGGRTTRKATKIITTSFLGRCWRASAMREGRSSQTCRDAAGALVTRHSCGTHPFQARGLVVRGLRLLGRTFADTKGGESQPRVSKQHVRRNPCTYTGLGLIGVDIDPTVGLTCPLLLERRVGRGGEELHRYLPPSNKYDGATACGNFASLGMGCRSTSRG